MSGFFFFWWGRNYVMLQVSQGFFHLDNWLQMLTKSALLTPCDFTGGHVPVVSDPHRDWDLGGWAPALPRAHLTGLSLEIAAAAGWRGDGVSRGLERDLEVGAFHLFIYKNNSRYFKEKEERLRHIASSKESAWPVPSKEEMEREQNWTSEADTWVLDGAFHEVHLF